ncbi:phage holin family protein [Altererythrobacter soli]|uniref:Phage holin family protein n=1 Tax=Croceibacterium soli TaxID=1739690 RepID=A0A6I4UPQ2_9SPHN|nr:phage holin family protein [Croceibacterium soli]MXP40772.1 phage holin family protein [Croceibacterium soli]
MRPQAEEDFAPLPGAGEVTLPRQPGGDHAASHHEAAGSAEERSLFEDVEVLIEDGKTYLEAELNFQKTRARFAGDHAKWVLAYGSVALVVALVALIALAVGLIIALTPHLSAWGATALVVVLFGVVAALAARAALSRVRELSKAFGSGTEGSR